MFARLILPLCALTLSPALTQAQSPKAEDLLRTCAPAGPEGPKGQRMRCDGFEFQVSGGKPLSTEKRRETVLVVLKQVQKTFQMGGLIAGPIGGPAQGKLGAYQGFKAGKKATSKGYGSVWVAFAQASSEGASVQLLCMTLTGNPPARCRDLAARFVREGSLAPKAAPAPTGPGLEACSRVDLDSQSELGLKCPGATLTVTRVGPTATSGGFSSMSMWLT